MSESYITVTENFIKTDKGDENIYISLAHFKRLTKSFIGSDTYNASVYASAMSELYNSGADDIHRVSCDTLVDSCPEEDVLTDNRFVIEFEDNGIQVLSEDYGSCWIPCSDKDIMSEETFSKLVDTVMSLGDDFEDVGGFLTDEGDIVVGENENGQVIAINVVDGKGVDLQSEHFGSWIPFKEGRFTVTAEEIESAILSIWEWDHGGNGPPKNKAVEGVDEYRVRVKDGLGVAIYWESGSQFIPFRDSTGTISIDQLINAICRVTGTCIQSL